MTLIMAKHCLVRTLRTGRVRQNIVQYQKFDIPCSRNHLFCLLDILDIAGAQKIRKKGAPPTHGALGLGVNYPP